MLCFNLLITPLLTDDFIRKLKHLAVQNNCALIPSGYDPTYITVATIFDIGSNHFSLADLYFARSLHFRSTIVQLTPKLKKAVGQATWHFGGG